jgi:cytochrome c oxidase subunit 2
MVRLTRRFRRPATRAALALFLALVVIALGSIALLGTAAAAGFTIAPRPWELGMQPAATPVKARLIEFHDELLVIISLITVFVMALLLYVIVRFDSRRHPQPTHTTHYTPIEVMWTVIPVLILVIIAVPSFKLMYYMDRAPKDSMTINVTGHQWYWSYAYPAQKIAFDSDIVQGAARKPGQPRLLTVNNPLVVPVGTDVRVLVASTDVIHSWFVPSFGVQEYAMPGRVNEAWFNVGRVGTYYGQCNQLCGLNHAFMPIEIKVVSKADFQRWLVEAKKKFAANPSDGGHRLRLAALFGVSGAARPAARGH